MDYRRRVRRNQILVVVAIIAFVIGCSYILGFTNFIKSILFVLPALVLLPSGSYYIIMNFDGRKQYFLFVLWVSFTFAVTSFVGMLMSGRLHPIDWSYIFKVSGLIWIITFVLILVMVPLYTAIYRFWKHG